MPAILVMAGLLAAIPAVARHRSHAQPASAAGDFDAYLLSLSVAPSFCAMSPRNRAKEECAGLDDAAYRRMPLTVHGLWPQRAGASVNQQPQHCPAPTLQLSPTLQAQLDTVMPGGVGLERHEWSRHGSCSDLDPEAYFNELVRLAHAADKSVGGAIRDGALFGRQVAVADLLKAVAANDPALGGAIVVSCRFPSGGGQALIEEIRIALSKQFRPIPASSLGLGQNSGCPRGIGLFPN